MNTPADMELSYLLPIKSGAPQAEGDLTAYLHWLAQYAEVVVIDGSGTDVFARHAEAWGGVIRHVPPDADLVTPMGKVGGVLTGVRLATHERLIIADDDVRYTARQLREVSDALASAHVVRPQNFFEPCPWHGHWDSARMLLNRLAGGDWPGTLGVRRSVLRATGGYDGRAMFENLELVRTVIAAGGTERLLLGTLVARRPSTARHFWSQRIRQAYDELARPSRMAWQLALLPAAAAIVALLGWPALGAAAAFAVGLAEAGRRRAGARAVFRARAALFAPVWLIERACCSWVALGSRLVLGGVPYRGTVLRHAATPVHVLESRFAGVRSTEAAVQDAPRTAPRRSA
jgi:hypothetical protein